MTNCKSNSIAFSPLLDRKNEVLFTGGAITSNAGTILLRELDNKIGLTKQLSTVFHDERDAHKIKHTQLSMLRQRIYSICCAHEDLNDQDRFRFDLCLQIVAGQLSELASKSTLSRLENSYTRLDCVAAHNIILECQSASKIDPLKSVMVKKNCRLFKLLFRKRSINYI